MEKEQIKDLMLYHLRNSFDLFSENHKVNVHPRENSVCINYRTTAELANQLKGTTHFDIQTTRDICYILWIELEKDNRGKGLGWQLYETVHGFARDFGCRSVRQTPSGWAFRKETRKEYLLKRGYIPYGVNEVELTLR